MERRTAIRQHLHIALEARQEILFAYLHGPFSDASLSYNDVDVAVYLSPAWSAGQDLYEYEMELAVDLTLALHIPVDAHVLNQVTIGFQHNVLHRGEPLFIRGAVGEEHLTNLIKQVGLAYMEFSYHARKYSLEVTS